MLHSISGSMTHAAYDKIHEISIDTTQVLTSTPEPSAGTYFSPDHRKDEDLKEMLDSNKDYLKLDAMKRIICMVAKGRDASSLFPAVVKNVVSKNIEIKKLVYSYLERYAEEKEDLVLLSISTFQRALKEPNQLIRVGALRILSGIRVKMIAPVVMIAIRDAVADMSPYVRKTAAHAIPKLYGLDHNTKDDLVVIIEKLLADKTVLVIGSAVMAFTKVCPERLDLIHVVYRKLCALLSDVDEWGQVIIMNMLTRYARTQFTNPKQDEDSSTPTLDPDHLLLIRSARPLLLSRNAAVVMSVVQTYHEIAPKSEVIIAVKSLIRLLKSNVEVQELVMKSLVQMTVTLKEAFEAYLKSFFVHPSDSIRVKLLKLTVLTNIANKTNVSTILSEIETYIPNNDDQFTAVSIQAIGRCACTINQVTNSCLTGLISLLSNKNEVVVAESVVVIKRLLQTQVTNPKPIIQQMTRLLPLIHVPHARASIIWLVGEHCRDAPTATNVLKQAAKSFASDEIVVKQQVLNLAVKVRIDTDHESDVLYRYILDLAKYDENYDIRDRSRFLRNFFENPKSLLTAAASNIFLAPKPAPTYVITEDLEQYQLGSISHYINTKAVGYEAIPSWPTVAPPTDVRDVKVEENLVTEETEHYDQKNFTAYGSDTTTCSSRDDQSGYPISSSDEEVEYSSSSNDVENLTLDESEDDTTTKDDDSDIAQNTLMTNWGMEHKSKESFEELSPSMVTPKEAPLIARECLNATNGNGLSISYRYTRNPHQFSPYLVNLNLIFTNNSTEDISYIKLGEKMLFPGMSLQEFSPVAALTTNCSSSGTLGVDFNDTLHPASMEIVSSAGNFSISIEPKVGELLRPIVLSEEEFLVKQQRLNDVGEDVVSVVKARGNVLYRINQAANLGSCPCSKGDTLMFAAQTIKCSSLVLVMVETGETVRITVNCERRDLVMVLMDELISALESLDMFPFQ